MALTRVRADQISDIDYKQAVRVITLTSITLSGGAPSQVDSVDLAQGDRVLVAGQGTGSQNGIYYVATLGTGSNGTWARTSDANATGEIQAGMIVMVTEGTIWQDTSWKLVTNNPITIGSTALSFSQNTGDSFSTIIANGVSVQANAVSSAVSFTPGNNFAITGNNTADTITFAVSDAPVFTGNVQAPFFVGNGVQFISNITPITAATGQAFWDTGEHTVTLGMENGVQQQIGLENYMYVKASAAITNGQAVMFTGANGTNILAAPANTASVGFKSEYIIGVATQDIANNAFGYITVYGLVHNLNTNAWNVGDILWVDNTTPGALTNTQPSDPNYQIQMAAVTKKAGGDGHIQVRVTPFYQLDRLRNVQTANLVNGQALVYDSANLLWVNGTIANAVFANTAATVTSNAQPNITSVGTLSSLSVTGNITGNYFIGNGSQLTGLPASYANANAVAYGESGWAGNIIPTGNAVYTLGNSTNQWKSLYVSGNTIYIDNVPVSTDGNSLIVNGNTVVVADPTGTSTTAGNVSITGNVAGGNITSVGVVSATGNITGDYFIGNGALLTGLPATYSNVNVAAYLASNTDSTILAIDSNISNTNSNVANLTTSLSNTNSNVANLTTTVGNTDSNVANLTTSLSNTNSNVANLTTTVGNTDSNVANLTTSLSNTNSNVANLTTSLSNTNSNVSNVASNVTTLQGQVYTDANVAAYLPTYTGNLAAGNVITTANATITNQNITIVGNTISSSDTVMYIDPAGGAAGLSGNVVIQGNLTVNGTTTTIDSNVITINDLTINLANNAATASDANGGGLEIGPQGGAYITWLYNNVNNTWVSSANISAVGNIAGDYFLGNGSQLTGIPSSSALANTDSNVANLTTSLGNTDSNVANLTTALSNTNSNVSNVASNVTTLQGQVYANANVFSYLGSNSNVVITTTGNITTIGNISADYLLGNGAFISGLPAGYSNADVANYLPTYTGNILSGNISTTGNVVINGNTQSGNISSTGNIVSDGNLLITSTANVGNITFSSTGIKIGLGAGSSNQGANSIAIGVNAGFLNQPANSIILNASGNSLNPTGNGFFVNPVRGDDSNIGNAVYFNPATYELTYSVAAPYIIWDNGGDMGLVTESVTTSQDLGLVTGTITEYYDLGIVTPDSSGPTVLTSYTVSTLPSASNAGSMVYVTDAPGGAVPAFADGLNWYSVTDRSLLA